VVIDVILLTFFREREYGAFHLFQEKGAAAFIVAGEGGEKGKKERVT